MPTPKKKTNRRGFVLVVVLMLVALLSVVLVEFQYEALINSRTMDNALGQYQALAAAEGGIQVAIAVLRSLDDTAQEGPAYDLFHEGLTLDLGESACTVRAVKENGKLSLTDLVAPDGNINRDPIDRLLALIDGMNRNRDEDEAIGYGLVPALIDWADRNDTVTQLPFVEGENRGAEENWYRQNRDWPCKNGPLETMEELLLVKGVDADVYGGLPGDDLTGRESRQGLKDLTTIYGDGKVDLNHAPEPVIAAFSDRLDPGVAAEIVAWREEHPFTSLQELEQLAGLDKMAIEIIGTVACVNPPDAYYRLTATGRAGGARSRVEVVLRMMADGSTEEIVLRREY